MSIPTSLTGAQIRAARALLNMSAAELCEATGLAINTVRRAEATNDEAPITLGNKKHLLSTFEAAGVVFLDAGELGVGVRLRDPITAPPRFRRRREADK